MGYAGLRFSPPNQCIVPYGLEPLPYGTKLPVSIDTTYMGLMFKMARKAYSIVDNFATLRAQPRLISQRTDGSSQVLQSGHPTPASSTMTYQVL